jgi:hypothetical protein
MDPAAGRGHPAMSGGHTNSIQAGHTSPSGSPKRSRSRSPPHMMHVLLAGGTSSGGQQQSNTRPAGPREMSEAVEAGVAAAAATKLARARALAPSPELAGWSDSAPPVLNPETHTVSNVGGKGSAPVPLQALNTLSTAAIASGALAGGGPPTSPGRQSRVGGGAGALRRSISPGPSLFPGMRVDSSGKVVVVPPASPGAAVAGGSTTPTVSAPKAAKKL